MNYKTKLLLSSCGPLIVLAVISLVVGVIQFRRALYIENQGNLRSTAFAAESLYSSHGYGNYGIKSDGNVWRGMNFNVSEEPALVDELKQKTGADITFFFGEKAVMTSIFGSDSLRLIGLVADIEIKNHTLTNGSQLWYKNIEIDGKNCQAYVIPLVQESGEVAGALMASIPDTEFRATINGYILSNMAITVFVLICVIMIIFFFVDRASKEFADAKQKSERDLLTGLYNKISFQKMAHQAISKLGDDETSVLIILDFDNFKQVNDNFGHQAGDDALRGFSDILKHSFRNTDIIGRVGGDEFMVYMTNFKTPFIKRVDSICAEILRKLAALDVGVAKGFSCSIGIATDSKGLNFTLLYTIADTALYKAKERGKACFARMDSENAGFSESYASLQ